MYFPSPYFGSPAQISTMLKILVQLTEIILLDKFKCLRLPNDLRATVGKSAMKFSDRSNRSKFSMPWNTSLLIFDSLLRPRSRLCISLRPMKAPPSTVDIMFPCKSISSNVFCDMNDACRIVPGIIFFF